MFRHQRHIMVRCLVIDCSKSQSTIPNVKGICQILSDVRTPGSFINCHDWGWFIEPIRMVMTWEAR